MPQLLLKSFKKENILEVDISNKLLEKSFSDPHFPKKNICFNGSPLKIMKNAFYFTLKAIFVFKIFKFLFWDFGHVEKTAWLER